MLPKMHSERKSESGCSRGESQLSKFNCKQFRLHKPAHNLSLVPKSIEWVLKENQVYNVDTDETENLKLIEANSDQQKTTKKWEVMIQLTSSERFT